MRSIYLFYLLIVIVTAATSNAKDFELDKLNKPGITNQGEGWSFFTDGVMGGLSEGRAIVSNVEDTKCYQMTGNVTTENNGGFIQIRTALNPTINANNYEGIYVKIYGNNRKYSLFVRTKLTVAPWQYYSYSFVVKDKWLKIKAPFADFKRSNFYQPQKLTNQSIKSIGLVAAFENFYANVCLAEIGLY